MPLRDRVICGDSREVLAGMETASVDAVITDPPYALTSGKTSTKGFMSATWDNGSAAHDPGLWAEVLRVARPGAFLLAFGGCRTYHRLVCAIEDAGWQPRDMINWLYATGFPKSKSCLKPAHEPILCAQKRLTVVCSHETMIAETTNLVEALLWSLLPAKSVSALSASMLRDSSLAQCASVRWLAATWCALASLEKSELTAMFNSLGAARTYWNIAWLWSNILDALSRDENTSTTSMASSLIIGLKTLNSLLSTIIPEPIIMAVSRAGGLWWSVRNAEESSSAPLCGWQHIPKPSVAEPAISASGPAIVSTLASIAEALSRPHHPTDDGFAPRPVLTDGATRSGASASPAHEPILLAKAPGPLQPLQIDATRVATGDSTMRRSRAEMGYGGGNLASEYTTGSDRGRWPSNLVLSHIGGPDGCRPAGVRRVKGPVSGDAGRKGTRDTVGAFAYDTVAITRYADADGYETVDAWTCVDGCPIKALDEQAGPRTSRPGKTKPNGRGVNCYGVYAPMDDGVKYADTDAAGSASRFFPTFSGVPDPEDAVAFRYAAKAAPSERRLPDGTRHTHPTTKPLSLMRWLVRLVARPGSVVLDPFAGSGTTALACIAEGCHYIAIDCDESYCAIARARIAWAQQHRDGPLFAGAEREA